MPSIMIVTIPTLKNISRAKEKLPSEYEQIYLELLERDDEEESEYLRGVYGNRVLMDMYLEDQAK